MSHTPRLLRSEAREERLKGSATTAEAMRLSERGLEGVMRMRGCFTVLLLVLTLLGAAPMCARVSAWSSGPAQAGAGTGQAPPAETTPPTGKRQPVDASRLPVNVDRIARRLKASPLETEVFSVAGLAYRLNVYALAPSIRLFIPGENQTTGPVRDSAPAHQDFIDFWSGWKRGRR